MSDTTPTSASASCCKTNGGSCCKANGGSCCTGDASTCPCAARLAKVERTVCRIRFWLFVSLGVLVLLIGIALGRGGAMQEMRQRMGDRGPAPQGAPMPAQGGPMAMAPRGGPMMGGEWRGQRDARAPRDDRRGPRRDRGPGPGGPRGDRGPDGGPGPGPRQGPGGPPDMN